MGTPTTGEHDACLEALVQQQNWVENAAAGWLETPDLVMQNGAVGFSTNTRQGRAQHLETGTNRLAASEGPASVVVVVCVGLRWGTNYAQNTKDMRNQPNVTLSRKAVTTWRGTGTYTEIVGLLGVATYCFEAFARSRMTKQTG